jgi:hypothetical protein
MPYEVSFSKDYKRIVINLGQENDEKVLNLLEQNYITPLQKDNKIYMSLNNFQLLYQKSENELDFTFQDRVGDILFNHKITYSHFHNKDYQYVNYEDINKTLIEKGFKRDFLSTQVRDISIMLKNPHSANFSVPGAGKTTTILGLNKLLDYKNLLVVLPNDIVMDSWEEEVHKFMVKGSYNVIRINSNDMIFDLENNLKENNLILITYSRLQQDDAVKGVVNFLLKFKTHMVLDESHSIKGAVRDNPYTASLRGRNILSTALFSSRRDLLSGTPMPHSTNDIISQFEFLYPSSDVKNLFDKKGDAISSHISTFYSRTIKDELELPISVNHDPIKVEMSLPQAAIYELIVSRYRNIFKRNRMEGIKRIQKIVERQIRASVDPYSLVEILEDLEYELNTSFTLTEKKLFDDIRDEGQLSNKMKKVIDKAESLVSDNQQVIIWSQFTSVIDKLSEEFSKILNIPKEYLTLYGKTTDASKNIELFNEANNDFKILIANPKKGGEGISLHYECSNTIYIDRSYDAGKYLQSRDRIHRVGSKFENVNFYFFESIHPNKNNLIDKSISDNLSGKLLRFYEMFSDPDIFKLHEFEEVEESDIDIGMTMSDIDQYLNEIENNELF